MNALDENVYFFTSRPKKPDDVNDDDDDAEEVVLRDYAKKSLCAFCERELFHSKERKRAFFVSFCVTMGFPCVVKVCREE